MFIAACSGSKNPEATPLPYGAETSVMDVYNLAQEALDQDQRVLIIFIDGFGYWSYESALERGDIPNLASFESSRASSVMPTITPVNYAAMVTGKPPEENGVVDRKVHRTSCDTIFDYALSLDKTAIIIEGDAQILAFSARQELNPDLDGDGGTDNEVFDCAIAAMNDNYDLMLVHFHGIDDMGHLTGPDSDETRAMIRLMDEYVGQLISKWGGFGIAVADHGQHENDGNGDAAYADKRGIHGSDAESDIIIPLLTLR